MADIHWSWHAFAELTPFQLYDALALREKAFTFEQACTEVDLDDVDQHCQHLLGYDGNTLAIYGRVVPPQAEKPVSFGRLVVAPSHRSLGLGKQATLKLMAYISEHFPNQPPMISAQIYLIKFYQDFGFEPVGEPYDEGGIDHVCMSYGKR